MDLSGQLLMLAHQIRRDHPTMGVREMYFKLEPQGIGRDAFEKLCMMNGLKVSKPKNWRKTTDSQGVKRFDNLLEKTKVRKMNQVWQSDITYFELNGRFYYITLIQDVYTKMIVGHHCSKRLKTVETTLPALERAINRYGKKELKKLIFHSDGGGQYYAKKFTELIKENEMKSSMGKSCYENAMAESLNGVIKNKYLEHYEIRTYEELNKSLDRVVKLYNIDKPHSSLNRMTPKEVEQMCLASQSQTKATMKKSIDAKTSQEEASSLHLTCQTKARNQISSPQRLV